MFSTVLIANRGAIACRIIRTLKQMGLYSVAVYHEADANSLHVQQADTSVSLGEGSAADTYLSIEKMIAAAKAAGAEAIHPGYGFLSENTEFVARCEQVGLTFIGPTAEQIVLFGLKHQARELAIGAGVPLVPGSSLLIDQNEAVHWANEVGYPVMLKSTAGGGGIGMQVCEDEKDLINAWASVKRLSANYFSNDGVFLEKYVRRARHIEVQIFGDGEGNTISLGERDCSAQRRNQKVIEETPAPGLTDELRKDLHQTAEHLMSSVNYRNAGTVEFIFDVDTNDFYFLEVNTRLQVEHGVTELVWGVDLVEWMLKQAAGTLANLQELKDNLHPYGHAIQSRVYAEDPQQDFMPCAGLLTEVKWPTDDDIRIDHWIESGIEVPALFDPMLAKVMVHQSDRSQALTKLKSALLDTSLYGIATNRQYLVSVLGGEEFVRGRVLTNTLSQFSFHAPTVIVEQAGTQTTIQDYPGRTGLWHIGVPPSGPMDSLSFRQANQLLNNPDDAAALEITLNGPVLRFNSDTVIAVTGAAIDVTLDDRPIAMFETVFVAAGQTVSFGKVTGSGARAYLAISGGFQCPDYLGSKATFTLGQFGGHVGRALRPGDVLQIPERTTQSVVNRKMPVLSMPEEWEINVVYGPHGAPDFFTDQDIETFFEATWEVHYNSSRTGVRLKGPKPEWARETGGEAGLHPSNIHDNAYAFGAVDFTGDMPVILGPDGPSLGGFVCPATVIHADLWKLGQLKAGAKVRFKPVTLEQATAIEAGQLQCIKKLSADLPVVSHAPVLVSPIVKETTFRGETLICRTAGDHFLLLELGELALDIERRFQVHALMLWFEKNLLEGMRELTPGIRSLQIHYDSQALPLSELLNHIDRAVAELDGSSELTVPSRIVHLPLSWDDEACQEAIEKYTQSVRPGAPWCPSNLEFIRRINGLSSLNEVKQIVFNASYLVMGLGDVYLGAPVATPVDPRHRLVTTKYNPARTWTAENSVGIGGAYLCIYGMEGPGGYQFVGRTLQMWNRYRQTFEFSKPWLLRFFDQIRFYEVSHEELVKIRRDFPQGKFPIRIEDAEFSLEEYKAFIDREANHIDAFQTKREAAFNEELQRWRINGQLTYEQPETENTGELVIDIPEGINAVSSPASGSVWQILKEEGDSVEKGETVMILESMKMEIEIHATETGTVKRILKTQGQAVDAGQSLVWLEQSN
ncbi:urea carboxylase [uncultured Endozoicomonas sp.]|uniref:urea carboxylase n=1 Tax=uncultured Endozoicomonas sp. TaxID=432652 RepID=UPI0026105351|nr:urea carboxylase [uncultured Endozoicomonas sp.]